MGILHFLLQGFHGLITDEIAQDLVSIRQCGGRTLTGDDLAVFLEQFSGIFGTREIFLETRGTGSLTAFQQTEGAEDHRGGTDGTDALAGSSLLLQGRTDALMGVEILRAGHASGQQEHVGITEISVLKLQISFHSDAVRGLDKLGTGDTHCLHVHASATEDIYGSQAFYLFEAIGQKFIHFCHLFLIIFK